MIVQQPQELGLVETIGHAAVHQEQHRPLVHESAAMMDQVPNPDGRGPGGEPWEIVAHKIVQADQTVVLHEHGCNGDELAAFGVRQAHHVVRRKADCVLEAGHPILALRNHPAVMQDHHCDTRAIASIRIEYMVDELLERGPVNRKPFLRARLRRSAGCHRGV